ncbi:MAG: biotin synthase BioB [Acidobacteria bacterium]|nr:biotin synthase BioB [Acidobacteriota bacterium]
MSWSIVARDAIEGRPPAGEAALRMLALADRATPALVEAAWRVREHHFGRRVKAHVVVSASRGGCAEDCSYCSQSAVSAAAVQRQRLLSPGEILERAAAARRAGAKRLCVVTAGRAAQEREIATVMEATRLIKKKVGLEVCASLGMLDAGTAQALKAAGVDAYNHNLNTAHDRYGEVCSTHRYEDRLATVAAAKAAGLEVCSGVIVGLGETDRELVEMAYALRDLSVSSIPVNFLLPVPGTALGGGDTVRHLTPWHCLRVLSMFRIVNPEVDLRISAGRERYLRSLQPLSLLICNSFFLGNYLTQPGQSADSDRMMVADLGLLLEQAPAAGVALGAPAGARE